MFSKKLKQRIITLEAQVRGLVEENRQLQVAVNNARLQMESYKKAVEMYQEKRPTRDGKGRFAKKGVR